MDDELPQAGGSGKTIQHYIAARSKRDQMKAYKCRLKLNQRFQAGGERTLALCRELYNAGLQERRDAWAINRVSAHYATQCVQLSEIKALRPELAGAHSQVLQQTLRQLQRAFENFFRRVKAGDTPGYPRFKSRDRFDSFCYPQGGFRLAGDKLHLSKIGSCRVRLSRPIAGTIKTCTIKREVDGWYVIFAVAENQCRYFPRTGDVVGVDVGIENFATLSTGEVIENLRLLKVERLLANPDEQSGRSWSAGREGSPAVHFAGLPCGQRVSKSLAVREAALPVVLSLIVTITRH